MSLQEIYGRAAELIRLRGWGQGSGPKNPTKGICLEQAFVFAASSYEEAVHASNVMRRYLNDQQPFDFNDEPGRKVEDIFAALAGASVLAEAAEIIVAAESQPDPIVVTG